MIKYTRILPAALAAILTLCAGRAAAQVPWEFQIQGRLTLAGGAPVPDGTKSVRFFLWDDQAQGSPWASPWMDVPVKNGAITAVPGSGGTLTPLNPLVISNWMVSRIGLQTDKDLWPYGTPTVPITPVPSTLRTSTLDWGAINTPDKIADKIIYASHFEEGTIDGAHIAQGTITSAKFASDVTMTGTAGGALTGTYNAPELAIRPASLARVSGGLITAGAGAATVDQQQLNTTVQDKLPYWQSFTPSRSGILSRLDIFTGAQDGASHAATLTLYNGEGDTGALMASQPITIQPGAAFQTFTLNPPIAVNAGSTYTWRIGDYSNIFVVGSANDAYAGGRNAGGSTDYAFKTFVGKGAIGMFRPPSLLATLAVADPGVGLTGILVGNGSNVASGSSAKLLISEDAAATRWPLQVERAGARIYGVLPDGSVFSGSSARLKEHIAPLMDGLQTALKLQPVSFDWTPEMGGGHDIGLVAEDTAAVLPELAVKDRDRGQTLGVRYDRVSVLVVQAIRQQQALIAAQRKEIADLEAQFTAMERGGDGAGVQP